MTRTIGPGPDPNQIYPLHPYNKLVFLKNFIKASNIHIGDYTYFDDKRHGPENFEEYNGERTFESMLNYVNKVSGYPERMPDNAAPFM